MDDGNLRQDQRADEREDADQHPGDENDAEFGNVLGDGVGLLENARADDGADDDRGRHPGTKHARQFARGDERMSMQGS